MTDKTIEALDPASFRRVRLIARAGDGRVKVRARTTVRPPSLAALLHLNCFWLFSIYGTSGNRGEMPRICVPTHRKPTKQTNFFEYLHKDQYLLNAYNYA
jgi:hypothetical protein